jgi:hypothetical protein
MESACRELRPVTDLSNSNQCRERTAHHLRSSHTMGIVSGLRFEQFGLRQEDSQLVVQAMKQRLKVDFGLRMVGA